MATNCESIFHKSINSIFNNWTALQLAVQYGYGGIDSAEKARWMVDVVENWMNENDNIEDYELAEFLEEILDNEFSSVADDGSLMEVSQEICRCFALCKGGRQYEVEQKYLTLPKASLNSCVKDTSDDISSDEEEASAKTELMDVSSTTAAEGSESCGSSTPSQKDASEMDDGWTVVKRSKQKRS